MKKPLRVLLVEDNADDAHLIIDELTQAGFDVTYQRIESAAEMRKALHGGPWDLVLADYALPNFNAAAALWLVKQVGYDLPFIIVSGTIADETAVSAMKAGAHDFITKDHLSRLGPAVERELAETALRADRARLAEQLRREQDRFRAVIERLPDALLIVAADGGIIYASPPLEKVAGYTPEAWVGRSIFDFVHPEHAKALAESLAQIREHGTSLVTGTHRFQHRDGSWRCIAVTCTNLLHETSVQGIVMTLRDVSAQICAQEELRRKAALLEAQLDAAADGVLVVDNEGHKVVQNRRLAELLRVPLDIALRADDPQQTTQAVEHIRRPQDFATRLAYLYAHPDETARDEVEFDDGRRLRRYSAPVLGRDGTRYGRLWVFHDTADDNGNTGSAMPGNPSA